MVTQRTANPRTPVRFRLGPPTIFIEPNNRRFRQRKGAILRLIWKWRNPRPKTAELAPLEERLSLWTHRSLYALMFIVPMSGWIASSAFGSPTKFFGLFTVPGIIEKSKPLVGPAYWAHFGLSWLLLTIVSLHIFAAFWHHDRKKDNVLRAMWFGRKRGRIDGAGQP